MAKITRKEKLILTREEAASFLRNADGRVRFHVRCAALLPIEHDPDHYFEGVTFLTVSKKQAIDVAMGLLSPSLQARGARLHIETDPPTSEGGLSFISIS